MAIDMEELDMSRLQVEIPEDLKTEAKLEAVRRGSNLSKIVEEALREYFKKNKGKG